MLSNLKFFTSLLSISIRASISKREAFLIESTLMIANNLIFFVIWLIFFRQFNDIAGWKIDDMTALMAIGTGSYGLMQICFGGVRNLSKNILNGDLDPFMTQPKNILLHLLGSKSFAKGWGHLMTSVILIGCGGIASFSTSFLILVSILCGCLVFTSINIVAYSFPFWFGSVEALSKKYCDSLFLFALYPTNIYSGLVQVLMFTVIPAGIIGYMPVELIRHFTWLNFLILLSSSIAFFGLSYALFFLGLRRYESGNKFGVRL